MEEISKEIIERAKDGDREAMSEIFETYKDYVMRSSYIMLGRVEEAEDVTENVFFKVFTRIQSFDIERDFRPWLSSIVINETRNYVNKNKITLFKDNADQTYIEPSTINLNREEILDVREGLKKLTQKEKEIITLRYYYELTIEEISRILKLPKNTVKVRIHRTLKKLRGVT
ncbi:MAG: RNA polymerase sigma factor [Caldisericia bacterium]|jgi:RNA polymerase sigma-70 factor (ECF subfamily)|nr:RNA polymerase sigma factor [Caldisericia bacterium]MDD3427730.1 RNA polymerase sigma factor [Caldisericia bacterium]MDD5689045.1 RNA polymerase sigma factor [Caldisericia bacterium]HOW02480.1 RNA polymerase sigma factor [Caldisericia bacterium]HQG81810.1 RNA polymerase sigma factor [Caldisericia bacterium]